MERIAPKRRPGAPRPKPNLTMLEARIRADLSREELGRMAGVSGKQIGLIERGVARRPRERTLNGIARVLEHDVLELFPERARL